MTVFTVSILIQSCVVMKDVPKAIEEKSINYSVNLNKVELPKDSKERFGDIITIEINKDSTRYAFEDDNMMISWFVGEKGLYFTLFNKSNYPIKINWDDVVFVDTELNISRVIHSGISYNKINESQASTTIPKGAIFKDYLVPVNNITMNNYSEWVCDPMIDMMGQTYNTKDYSEEQMNEIIKKAESMVGLTFSILFPLKIEDVQNDYTFVFQIEKTGINVAEKTIIEQEPEISAGRTIILVATLIPVAVFTTIGLFGLGLK